MKSSSVLLISALTQYASAFPGMGNIRKDPGLLPLKPLAKAVSTSSSASSTYPAWHPQQSGEGMRIGMAIRDSITLTV